MDHPNAISYRRTADAFRAGDFTVLASLIDPDVVWFVPGSQPRSGVVRGRQAVLAWLRDIASAGLWLREHDVLANDEHVCVLSHMGVSRPGLREETRVVSIFHFREGKQLERWFYPEDLEVWDRLLGVGG